MRPRDRDDDPDAPASEEERRAAAALRRTLGSDSTNTPNGPSAAPSTSPSSQSPGRAALRNADALTPPPSSNSPQPLAQSSEARWLTAHLRYPKPEDSLGEVKARRLARMAQEAVHLRRVRNTQRASSWARLGRSLSSTAGLLGAAGLLLLVSWLILDQGDPRKHGRSDGTVVRLSRVSPPSARVTAALLWRQSLELGKRGKKDEGPVTRLDLMIQRRLNELRGSPLDPVPGARGLAVVGLSGADRGAP